MSTLLLVVLGVAASVVMTFATIGIAVLFGTSPKARAIFFKILASLPF
jgi:hypothetical protein